MKISKDMNLLELGADWVNTASIANFTLVGKTLGCSLKQVSGCRPLFVS